MNEQSQLSVIGIDVSKETLDAYHLPSKEYKKVGNNKKGFKEIITWAKKHNIRLVLCEAAGGYQHKLVIALTNDEIHVNVANPTHIRYFAKSKGCLSKTDKIDAKIIAELGTGCADSVCALVGVVPVNRDSRKMRGKRSIFRRTRQRESRVTQCRNGCRLFDKKG